MRRLCISLIITKNRFSLVSPSQNIQNLELSNQTTNQLHGLRFLNGYRQINRVYWFKRFKDDYEIDKNEGK